MAAKINAKEAREPRRRRSAAGPGVAIEEEEEDMEAGGEQVLALPALPGGGDTNQDVMGLLDSLFEGGEAGATLAARAGGRAR